MYMITYMGEVRVTLSKELKSILDSKAKSLGIKTAEYVRSLIIEDIKKGGSQK